uniref:Uncharacterized protein n=1 Tax=Anguilla anguilla TaxID=7936 RepID=A0A0E9TVI0_ANGAN
MNGYLCCFCAVVYCTLYLIWEY